MRYRPHYIHGRRIYYLEWRKYEKRRQKRVLTTCVLSACALFTGFTMTHSTLHGSVPTLERSAGVSAYTAAIVKSTSGVKADETKSVGDKSADAVSEEMDAKLRAEAGLRERQEDFEHQKAEEEKAAEEARIAQEEAQKKAAEEAAAKAAAEKAQAEALEQAKASAAEGNVPMEANRSAHPYMPYTAVTNTGTKQYQVLNSPDAWSDPATGLRMVGDRICIAIGQGYGMRAGDKVDVVLDDGSIVKCILGDMKARCDTDPTGCYHNVDGDVVEMIVDYSVFSRKPAQYLGVFHGQPVKKLVKVD